MCVAAYSLFFLRVITILRGIGPFNVNHRHTALTVVHLTLVLFTFPPN